MANVVKSGNIFRKSFTFANKDVANWFPGHMHKGTIINYKLFIYDFFVYFIFIIFTVFTVSLQCTHYTTVNVFY